MTRIYTTQHTDGWEEQLEGRLGTLPVLTTEVGRALMEVDQGPPPRAIDTTVYVLWPDLRDEEPTHLLACRPAARDRGGRVPDGLLVVVAWRMSARQTRALYDVIDERGSEAFAPMASALVEGPRGWGRT